MKLPSKKHFLVCTGPRGAEYRCIGETAGGCPRADEADLIVLDAWLESAAADRGL